MAGSIIFPLHILSLSPRTFLSLSLLLSGILSGLILKIWIREFFIEYLLNREDVKPLWHAHVHHDFVKRIGDGTLPIEKFKAYLVQDYLFLVQFARAKALSAYKTNSIEDIASVLTIPPPLRFYSVVINLTLDQGAEEILHIQREMSLHLDYCAKFGLSKKEVEEHEEHQGNFNHYYRQSIRGKPRRANDP